MTPHRKVLDRVAVVMIPYERYSTFSDAVESLYQSADHPFHLIVVEGNAPDSVRSALESHTKKFKNLTIIYTNHVPAVGQAMNLALAHAKSPYAFFMPNDGELFPGSLSALVKKAKEAKAGIVYPDVVVGMGHGDNRPLPLGPAGEMRPFLATAEALKKLGEFDERIGAVLFDAYLKEHTRNAKVASARESFAVLTRKAQNGLRPMDAKLFDIQWSVEDARTSLRLLSEQWGLRLSERETVDFLYSRRRALSPQRSFFLIDDQPFADFLKLPFIKTARKGMRRIVEPLFKP